MDFIKSHDKVSIINYIFTFEQQLANKIFKKTLFTITLKIYGGVVKL